MKAICEECGREITLTGEAEYSAKVSRFFVCDECLSKSEMPDPCVDVYGFPRLTGSPKQVEWAVDIRAKAIKKYGKKQNKKHTIDDFKNQTSAKWWIENR